MTTKDNVVLCLSVQCKINLKSQENETLKSHVGIKWCNI